jgi:Na+/alanine symporter
MKFRNSSYMALFLRCEILVEQRDGLHAPWLAFLCSIFMVVQIIGGNFIQSNTIGGVVEDTFQIPPIYTGIILTVLIFVVSAGGLKRFAHVARKVVPFMATLYIASGLLIILINIKQLPGVFADIFAGAFGLRAVSGGVLGSMIIAMQKGIARGLYSNEAGEGSAPVLHSAADVEPCRAGNCRCNRGIPGYICHLHDHRFGVGRHRSDRSRDLRKRTAAVCL